jgi:glycosyltransferase involved in cell wall biosynthesis
MLSYLNRVISFAFIVTRLINKNDVSLLHANGFISALYAFLPAKLTRRPLIWHMNDILETGMINKLFVRIASLGSRSIICVSEAVKTGLTTFGVPEAKCRLIYNPAPAPVRPEPETETLLRNTFGIPEGASIIGMIGNICRLKGQMQFVQAANELRIGFPKARFLVVGQVNNETDRPYEEQVRGFVKEHRLEETVFMTGFLKTDIKNVIRIMDILVHPPVLPDSFPLVLLEAMSEGKPIVATITGGIPEAVVDGLNGMLVPPEDHIALAAAIAKLLGDSGLRASMGAAGREMSRVKFGPDEYLLRIKTIYAEL